MDKQQMLNKIYDKIGHTTIEYTLSGEVVEYYNPNVSFARVLSMLGDRYFFDKCIFQKTDRDEDGDVINTGYICNRKLLNDDGRDAILEDQSDETITAIYNILFSTK